VGRRRGIPQPFHRLARAPGLAESSRHRLKLAPEPPDLVPRPEGALSTQASPGISVTREDGSLLFESQTGEFMLRARVADAMSAVCDDWRERVSISST
jgi:hypothetical protein